MDNPNTRRHSLFFNLTLRYRLLFTVIALAIAAVLFFNSAKRSRDHFEERASLLVRQTTTTVNQLLTAAFLSAQDLANTIANLSDNGINDTLFVQQIQKNQIERFPWYICTGIIGSKELFPTISSEAKNQFNLNDSTYFVSSWYRHNNAIRIRPFGPSSDGKMHNFSLDDTFFHSRPYYTTLRDGAHGYTTDIYEDRIGDRRFNLFSVAAPIRGKKHFLGASVLDISFDDLSKGLHDLLLENAFKGSIALINLEGETLLHSNSERVGKAFAGEDTLKRILQNSKLGNIHICNTKNANGESCLQASMPFSLDFSQQTWIAVIQLPLKELNKSYFNLIGSIAILVVATMLIFLILSASIARMVARPLANAAERIQALEQGDFRSAPRIHGKDKETNLIDKSTEQVRLALSTIAENFKGMAKEIDASATLFSQAASAIAEASNDQAASVEQVSASLHNLTDSAKISAENADQVKQTTETIALMLEHLIKRVKELIENMVAIANRTDQIRDMASQTNLLALNAAVEAARAGEAGKGFGVVANEVRNLAEKAMDFAQSIAVLAENGVAIANLTEKDIAEIMPPVYQNQKLANTAAQSAVEDANMLLQVTTGITQLSDRVQLNAQQSDEMNQGTQNLYRLTQNLNQNLDYFKTDGNATPSERK